MDEKIRDFRAQLSRLRVAADHLKGANGSIDVEFLHDFTNIIDQLKLLLGTDISFLYSTIAYNAIYVSGGVLQTRMAQALAYLTERYAEELGLAQAKQVTDSLRDKQLRDRCVDLLIADDNFDRAVSEATRVLEDRIRKKSALGGTLSGAQLVNAAIKQEKDKSVLILSEGRGRTARLRRYHAGDHGGPPESSQPLHIQYEPYRCGEHLRLHRCIARNNRQIQGK